MGDTRQRKRVDRARRAQVNDGDRCQECGFPMKADSFALILGRTGVVVCSTRCGDEWVWHHNLEAAPFDRVRIDLPREG